MNVLENFHIRFAQEKDTAVILEFICSLAEYEQMSTQVSATQEDLRYSLFEKKQAEVILGECDGKPVGFALFFHNYSTFLGKAGIYLEDLFVLPQERGKGYGKALFIKLAQIAAERKCDRLEWQCLDWNQSSIDFYRSLGAEAMNEWTTYRICGDTLIQMGMTVRSQQ